MKLSKLTDIELGKRYKGNYTKLKVIQRREKIRAYICSYRSYFVIFIITGLLISLSFISIYLKRYEWLFIINMDRNTASLIVDQRITNTAAIIGVSFVVIGLMINNLKEKTKSNYELLFTATYLYPLTYFVFSVVIFLITLSFLRNTLSELIFVNAVEIISVLIIIIIVCIVILFTKVIKIFEPNYLNELSLREYLNICRDVVLKEKIFNTSFEVFKDNMVAIGGLSIKSLPPKFNGSSVTLLSQGNYLKDINMKRLVRILRQKNPQMLKNKTFYFETIQIGDYMHMDLSPFRFEDEQLSVSQIRKIEQAFSFTIRGY